MADDPCLMVVHAHPDDECISTGGLLAKAAAEGIRTVLVTCTDGRCGDGPGGVKPGEPGHEPGAVAAMRLEELRRSAALLGVQRLETLGYHDSGMMGWATNDAPGAFWGMQVFEAAAPLVALMAEERPQVVVTYDANGFYGHPDHIMAHRVAMAATAASGIPERLFYTAVGRSMMARFGEVLREAGMEMPEAGDDEEGRFAASADAPEQPAFGTPDQLVTTTVDVTGHTAAKRASMQAHASQADNIFFLKLGDEVFDRVFRQEQFTLAVDRRAGDVPADDLFAGLR